jgi:tRNA(adenine34) deaminase
MQNQWDKHMQQALQLAKENSLEVPVGALILNLDGELIATGVNKTISNNDPTAHAEIVAMREAAEKLQNWRLEDCTLVVTLEPCVMCAGAIKTARIPRVIFGAWDERAGGSGSRYDVLRDGRLGPEVEVIAGVMQDKCSELLSEYFKSLRD